MLSSVFLIVHLVVFNSLSLAYIVLWNRCTWYFIALTVQTGSFECSFALTESLFRYFINCRHF